MQLTPIKTRIFTPPQDDLFSVLEDSLPALQEGDILLITSKVLAIHQGRCVRISNQLEKDRLIRTEADRLVPRSRVPGQYAILTLKNHTLVASAGIDESNGNGYYILWPKDVQKLLRSIWSRLRKANGISWLGIIATDSHMVPMRYGVLGVSIGWFGFHPLIDRKGAPDLFGRKLLCTTINIPDALAAAGVLLMGESNESTPLLLARGVASIRFTSKDTAPELLIPPEDDIYKPLLSCMKKPR
ncbi:MAG: coenzyme F420-0:L-glutamate ligase [Patescibacteria group bacterium]